MPDILTEQKLYLEARLKDCLTRPDLNQNQIREYNKYLEMLSKCKDANEYADKIALSGDMFSIAQAEQMDRYENLIRLKLQLGDQKGAQNDQLNLEAAQKSVSHMDLSEKLNQSTQKVAEQNTLIRKAIENVMNLFGALVTYHVSAPQNKAAKKLTIQNIWKELTQLDPEISWEKIMSYPPYRNILIFDEKRLFIMKQWLMEATNNG